MKHVRGRFAPSPSGRMHLGNVYSAVMSWLSARSKGGQWVLRIEDLDRQRCKAEHAAVLEDDLLWLGLCWDEGGSLGGPCGPYRQSERDDLYAEALARLDDAGLLYPCYCRRADLMSASAPHASDGVPIYSGRCRHLSVAERAELAKTIKPSVRLGVPDAISTFIDGNYGRCSCNMAKESGDIVVRRADGNFAYQLAVVVDDALMGITEVVRGADLLSSTHRQLFLYDVLGYKAPDFYHVPMLLSPDGRRLAKRDAAADMGWVRQHNTPEQVLGLIGSWAGIIDSPQPISLAELLAEFSWSKVPTDDVVVRL